MTRILCIACLALAPYAASAEGTEEKVELPDLAVDALVENAGGAGKIVGLELSRPVRHDGATTLCATSNAHDRNGNFIGLSYWQVTFDDTETEVTSVTNVTGLLSACYGETYKLYGNN
ncbi:hypothetical protein ACFMPD_12675 [Sedimentitalea sp. HM32M-2]|uniref:hypothetical protein n=1 Tax=Sedimentitalea sp. HM32M-2 TaxID=3351566 RepID=UPI0036262588